MKQSIRLIFSVLLIVCSLTQICSAASIPDPQQLSVTEDAVILSSYSIGVNNACDHSYTRMEIGDIVKETCTSITYNYQVWCHLCERYITGGTIVMPKDTPEHTFRWYSVSCIKGTHTYERRCARCGYATESLSRPCSGPPCPDVMR